MIRTSRDLGGSRVALFTAVSAVALASACTGSPAGDAPGGPDSGAAGDRGAPPNDGSGGAAGTGAGGHPGPPLPPPDPSCGLPNAAFCDAFTKASPGGRAGALDDAHWTLSRLGLGCAYTFA